MKDRRWWDAVVADAVLSCLTLILGAAVVAAVVAALVGAWRGHGL